MSIFPPTIVPTMQAVANEFNISASQVKTFKRCPRLWALEKVYKVKQREAYHFKLGHSFHAIAERYLSRAATDWSQLFPNGWSKGLEPEDAAWCQYMAEQAVELGVWKSKPGISIEHPVAYLVGREHLDHRGLPLLAEAETFVDAKDVRRVAKLTRLVDGRPLPAGWDRFPPFVGFIDHLDLPEIIPEVVDQKTSKKRVYALTSAKLAKDPQVLSYAATPLVLRPDADRVTLKHNYFLKDPTAKEPVYTVEAEASLAMVQENWSEVLQISEDMATIRKMAPITNVPGQPEQRANNYHLIRSAIDMGCTRESCEAYSGCAFRDACFGRATIAQVLTRLDAPDITDLVRSRGILAPPTTRPRSGPIRSILPEKTMFPAPKPAGPKFAVHQQVYVRDPDNANAQFVCMVLNSGSPGVSDPIVAVYPDPDVEPNTTTLPDAYVHHLPEAALQSVPYVGATITGYAATLVAAGQPAPAWQPATSPRNATPAAPVPPAPARPLVDPNAQPPQVGMQGADGNVTRPERDGKFGSILGASAPVPAAPAPPAPPAPGLAQGVLQPGVGAALAGQVARVQADAAAAAPPASTGYLPQVGDIVQVKATAHPFWSKHSGKQAQVVDAGVGDSGPDATVLIDGVEYPNVAASRFDLMTRTTPPPPPAPPAAAPSAPVLFEDVVKLKGQLVCVRLKGSDIPQNGALGDVYQAEGGPALSMHNGALRVFLANVESCRILDLADVPGAIKKKVKLTPEEKAAAKEAKKAEKVAAKAAAKAAKAAAATPATAAIPGQQTVPGTEGLAAIVPPLTPGVLVTQADVEAQIQAIRDGLERLASMVLN